MAQRVELPERLQRQLASCGTLPSIPAVAVRVIDMCRKDDAGIPEIAEVLAIDPALAVKVLRTANSAAYCVRSPATTLDRAISILGINTTLSLALSFSLVGTLHKPNRQAFHYRKYWRRSVTTAATAKALGARSRASGSDEYFLAGLLQDIGMLALNEAVSDAYGQVVSRAGGDHEELVVLERGAFGADHGAVGAWLLERWKLPAKLIASVAASHTAEPRVDEEIAAFCREVAFAGHCAEIYVNPRIAEAACRAQRLAYDLLQMPPDRFAQLLENVALSLPEITTILEVEIGTEEILNRLRDQAREALVDLNLQSQLQVRRAQDEVIRDGMTSLYNRRYLEQILPQSLDEAVRQRQPLSILFADIDHFKDVNDTHGHQVGDQVLAAVAELLRDILRSSDTAVRYGGEEFVCVLPNTDRAGALRVAERIRRRVAETPQKAESGVEVPVTISIGCATLAADHSGSGAAGLLQAADRCLYAAKTGGRNRVVVAA